MNTLLALALICQAPTPTRNPETQQFEGTDARGKLWGGPNETWLRGFLVGRNSVINETPKAEPKPEPKAAPKPRLVRYGDAG